MKVYVQIVDTSNGIFQSGMIEEPVKKGFEIQNALAHFGVLASEINWVELYNGVNYTSKFGEVSETTKIVNIIYYE